jgi:hypothetical protein
VCRRMLGKVLQSLSITYEEAEDGVQAVEKMQMSLESPSTPSTPMLPIPKGDRERERERRSFDLILVSSSSPFILFYSTYSILFYALVLTNSCLLDLTLQYHISFFIKNFMSLDFPQQSFSTSLLLLVRQHHAEYVRTRSSQSD